LTIKTKQYVGHLVLSYREKNSIIRLKLSHDDALSLLEELHAFFGLPPVAERPTDSPLEQLHLVLPSD